MPRWLPFLIPILYLAAILALQPADHLGDSDAAPWLGRLLYDDYDETAYALRGLNANQGRQAGRLSEPTNLDSATFTAALKEPSDPHALNAPYFLEYPHAALQMFRLGFLSPPDTRGVPVPVALLDAYHLNVVQHDPAHDSEEVQLLWRKLRGAIRVYVIGAVGCLLGLMAVLAFGYEPGRRNPVPLVALLLPATLYFTANRFDIVPALLTALSFACLGRRHVVASGLVLGLATMIKVYPVLLCPLVIRYVSDQRGKAAAWTLAYGLTVGAILSATLVSAGWEAATAPFRYQLARTLEALTLYGHVLPRSLGENTPLGSLFRLGAVGITVLLMIWKRPETLDSLLRRAALVLLVFVSLQVFYSPQWIVWFAPFLIPLAGKQRSILLLLIGLDLVTYLTFPVVFDMVNDEAWYRLLMALLIVLRTLFLASLAAVLIRAEWARPTALSFGK